VSETNPVWRPIGPPVWNCLSCGKTTASGRCRRCTICPDPVDTVLRLLWSYQDRPIRFITATRYRMAPEREAS
jgi:hypothetical protein